MPNAAVVKGENVNLKVVVETNAYSINIPDDVSEQGESFFAKMDEDMAKGWQMDRQWIESPTIQQRCQIAASRIADALESNNETLAYLMAGYILKHMPSVNEVHIDTEGEMLETRFINK
ncbi:MAG: hypothetical protein COB30_018110 [Ectothiorhodospiraceae bacterium]|nr:hypothetical protein [Ectothiorhodospiraceae bacterium]MBN4053113.1 hypothetical protein [Gammaproteobacteria bacterium AH-315-K14]